MIPKFSQNNCLTYTFLVSIQCEFQLSTSSYSKGPFFDLRISPYLFFNVLLLFSYLLLVTINCVFDMICTGSYLVKAKVVAALTRAWKLLKLAQLQTIEVKLKRHKLI